jgi:hypothetical protein
MKSIEYYDPRVRVFNILKRQHINTDLDVYQCCVLDVLDHCPTILDVFAVYTFIEHVKLAQRTSKLEYVEIRYSFFNEGESIVCHYANGKMTTHPYSWQACKKYILQAQKNHNSSWDMGRSFCLDNKSCLLLSFVHIWHSQYI